MGLRDLHEGEYVSVWVYNNADQEYTMYGSLYNSSFAHLFLLAAFRIIGVQLQPASVPLVETTFDEPVMIFIYRFRCC